METDLARFQPKWLRVCTLLHRIMEILFYPEPIQMTLILGYLGFGRKFGLILPSECRVPRSRFWDLGTTIPEKQPQVLRLRFTGFWVVRDDRRMGHPA